jgi:cytoplasmic iron level regulating protein YaaA (DUF328/UPF0246 family)
MRQPTSGTEPNGVPVLLDRAEELIGYLRTLSPRQLSKIMGVSADLATKTKEQYAMWTTAPDQQAPAAASFVGDIYSGLRIDSLKQPRFVVVHAKIARGAFARWLITQRVNDTSAAIRGFNDIGYRYDEALSRPGEPAFVCQEFGGKGLSVRLT